MINVNGLNNNRTNKILEKKLTETENANENFKNDKKLNIVNLDDKSRSHSYDRSNDHSPDKVLKNIMRKPDEAAEFLKIKTLKKVQQKQVENNEDNLNNINNLIYTNDFNSKSSKNINNNDIKNKNNNNNKFHTSDKLDQITSKII
jgi:hypothetical protein